eukprot:3197344-Prymnesium_polylepis.1
MPKNLAKAKAQHTRSGAGNGCIRQSDPHKHLMADGRMKPPPRETDLAPLRRPDRGVRPLDSSWRCW